KHISDRIGVMYLGMLAETAESEELYRNPIHPYTKALLSAIPVPDPKLTRQNKRIVLKGDVPSPIDPPEGCRFASRCPLASDKCRQVTPHLTDRGAGHMVACHNA
ncbi:MAG: ABC transporter ATP-binding protein, partial [Spirochaetaceae bacterium]|nr:ABC transporter ATP-binding protein [Spirochaetaceae bacterium]